MSFKSRFITEAESAATITEKVNQASDSAKNHGNFKASPGGVSPIAQAATIAAPAQPVQSIVRSGEAVDDLNRSSVGNVKPNPTANDADKVERVLDTTRMRADSRSSVKPFNESTLMEAGDINLDKKILPPYANMLTKKLDGIGLNTGVRKSDVDARSQNTKTGHGNITSGQKSSQTYIKNQPKHEAKTGLKDGMHNIPGADEVKRSTKLQLSSVYFKIGKLVEEYTNADVESKGPVKHAPIPKGLGVQPGNHSNQSLAQTKAMNDITEDKMDKAAGMRKMTSPEVNQDYAAAHTTGLKADQYKTKYATDSLNAQTSAQREDRLNGNEQNNG